MKTFAKILCITFLGAVVDGAQAQSDVQIDYQVRLLANASTGNHAPYMIGSWNYGRVTGDAGVWNNCEAVKSMDLNSRFSWGAGVEYMLGYGSAADYLRWDNDLQKFYTNHMRQAPVRLQQFYGEIKFRGAFITVGMKHSHSGIVDDTMSSGDFTRSNNARPVPGVAVGFVDFQNIPFTGGWLQVNGELMYGKMTDTGFKKDMFNYYNGVLGTNLMYTYKRCYFRTKPTQPLVCTFGMQSAALFGGTSTFYKKGVVTRQDHHGFEWRDLVDMFFPIEGNEDYYKGSSLGSWDFKAEYFFENGSVLKAYFEWPWEDGSGIGRQNGWDGIWGLQYNFAKSGPVSKILFEYLDFTNQSGPIHFAPGDFDNTDLTSQATGADDYYNNGYYGSYANYGMSMGTPFLKSPLYNKDGAPVYLNNRARGFHAAIMGEFGSAWAYRAMLSYQQAGGSGRFPARHKLYDTSMMVDVMWSPARLKEGLSLHGMVAFDAGHLRGNNFGLMVGVKYSGDLVLKKNSKK